MINYHLLLNIHNFIKIKVSQVGLSFEDYLRNLVFDCEVFNIFELFGGHFN